MLVRTAECLERTRRDGAGVRAGVRLRPDRRRRGRWSTSTSHVADASGRRRHDPPAHRHALGVEGHRVRGSSRAASRRAALLRAVVGRRELAAPATDDAGRDERSRPRRCSGGRGSDRARIPDHRYRGADPTLGAGDQGADVHADRRDRGRADDVAAGDARRRAQLGLPLQLDARLDVHPAGAALAEPRLGGRRVHAVRRRPRSPTTTARCRSCTASTGGAT